MFVVGTVFNLPVSETRIGEERQILEGSLHVCRRLKSACFDRWLRCQSNVLILTNLEGIS